MRDPRTPGPRLSRRSLVLSVLLAAVLLFFAFRGVDWGAMGRTFRHGHPVYMALAFLLYTLSFFLRALRWRVLLSAEKPIPPLTVFWAICVGYLGNNFLPARAGEVMRAVLLGRAAAISVGFVFATAITERVMDVVALVLISLGALTTLHGMPGWVLTASRVMAVVGAVGFVILLIAPRMERSLKGMLVKLPISPRLQNRGIALLEQFLLGLRAFQHPIRASNFAGLTVLIWLIDAFAAIAVGRAFDLHLSLAQALLLLAALGLASAAPSTPGYVGIYQFVAVTILVPFGFSRSNALVYILALQATIYVVVLVYGSLGMWQLNWRAQPAPRPPTAGMAVVELHDRGA